MLSIENLCISKQGRSLVDRLSVTLLPGACLIIRGENGSGKTTLLRTLAGLEKPDRGHIVFDGELAANDALFAKECQLVGHQNAMKPYLSVEENLLFWAHINEAELAMPAAIHMWQLEPVLDQPYGTLSQGWKRRIALARLLVSPGRVWLMDEPMANLDNEGVYLMEKIILSRCEQGGIVIISSHIHVEIEGAQDIFMHDINNEQYNTVIKE